MASWLYLARPSPTKITRFAPVMQLIAHCHLSLGELYAQIHQRDRARKDSRPPSIDTVLGRWELGCVRQRSLPQKVLTRYHPRGNGRKSLSNRDSIKLLNQTLAAQS